MVNKTIIFMPVFTSTTVEFMTINELQSISTILIYDVNIGLLDLLWENIS